MGVYQRSELAKTVMKGAEGMIRKTPTTAEFGLLGKRVSFETGRIEKTLGWRPAFPMADALPLTAAWLRHHGYVPEGDVQRETS